ncbi:MAG TPA: hypothetical protein VIA62_29545 [Thermoanaerobaculia bacterium]|jgi:hypothetical protein|nr:hypothetical protein [Thermoanaerobaculia bacterium]
MKKRLQKLTLNRETLRYLESNKLGTVAGANTLFANCSDNCTSDCSGPNACMSNYISGCNDCPSWDDALCS